MISKIFSFFSFIGSNNSQEDYCGEFIDKPKQRKYKVIPFYSGNDGDFYKIWCRDGFFLRINFIPDLEYSKSDFYKIDLCNFPDYITKHRSEADEKINRIEEDSK